MTTTAAGGQLEPAREQRRTLAVAAAGTLLVLVVFTTPLTTLPSIARGLGAGANAQTWLLASISLGLGAALLTAGAVADDYGRRRMLVAGAGLLAAASLVCTLARGPLMFILGGVAQGVGGAAVLACSLGLIGHAFPLGPARARAAGIWGASVGAGIAAGPLLAAGLELLSGWRAAYGLTTVCALALTIAGQVLLPESRADDTKPVDLPGVLLLGSALAALVAGLVEGRTGWDRPLVVGLLAIAAVLAASFVLVEHRRHTPMLDLALFRRPAFVAVTVAALSTGLGIIPLMSYLPTLLQRGLHGTALMAAVIMLAWSATSVVTALAARHLPVHISGRAQLAAGLLVIAAGQVALYGLTNTSTPWRLLPGLLVAGAGSGVLNAALGREAVESVPAGRGGMGSGANNTARYVGSSIGVSIVVAVITAAGTSGHALIAGWNTATLVTAALSAVGAAAVLACRPR